MRFPHLWYGVHSVVALHQFIFGGHAVLSFPHSCKKQHTESKQAWVTTTLPRLTQAVKNLPQVLLNSLYREIITHSANLHMKVIAQNLCLIFQHELQHSVLRQKGDTASTAIIIFIIKSAYFRYDH